MSTARDPQPPEPSPADPGVLITGASGVIGTVLRAGWTGRTTSFDRPEHDARDAAALTAAAGGHDALVHLAWDTRAENFRNRGLAPDNLVMTRNVLEAAVAAGVPRVVLASSVHADAFAPGLRPRRSVDATPTPDSPYGASKVFLEALGRHYAAHRGLEVVAIRFGGVNRADVEPEGDASERAVWLPHADCVALVRSAVTAPLGPGRFALVVGVGDGPERVHDFGDGLPWRPSRRDGAA